jgi:hypothetical protein
VTKHTYTVLWLTAFLTCVQVDDAEVAAVAKAQRDLLADTVQRVNPPNVYAPLPQATACCYLSAGG